MEFKEFLITQGVSRQTAKTYDDLMAHFKRITGLNGNVTVDTVGEFIAKIEEANTSRTYFYAFKRYGQFLGKDLVSKITPPKQKRPLPKALKDEEAKKILDSMAIKECDLRNKSLAVFLISSGLRISEAIAIKIKEIGLDGALMIFGKGNKERQVFIEEECRRLLNEYISRRKQPSEFLFTTRKGTPLSRQSAEVLLKEWARKIQLKFHPHQLRHTYATDMLRSGCDLESLRNFLGHSSVATTQGYLRVTPELLKNNYAKFSPIKFLRGK